MRFKVRPFDEVVERGLRPGAVVAGRIVGASFMVSLDALSVPLATGEVGQDEDGSYAVLEEQQLSLGGGFMLEVGVGFPPSMGCEISIAKSPPRTWSRVRADRIMRGQQEQEWSDLSIHFDPDGEVDGRSYGGRVPDDEKPFGAPRTLS
ncbi:MAG: hypothetical protein U0807_15245 [Candidatus Binatia bacterium]